jgi:hypothetical protein
VDADALEYNRRHRDVLLAYAKRGAIIALCCAAIVPILGFELGLSTSVCVLLLALTVYVVFGLED